jgi:hypothetical protein
MKGLVQKEGVNGCKHLILSDYNNLKVRGLKIVQEIITGKESNEIFAPISEIVQNYTKKLTSIFPHDQITTIFEIIGSLFKERTELNIDAFIVFLESTYLLKIKIEFVEVYKKIAEFLCNELKEQESKLKNSLKINKEIKNRMLEIFKYITAENNTLGSAEDYICLIYLLIYNEGSISFLFMCVFCVCDYLIFFYYRPKHY